MDLLGETPNFNLGDRSWRIYSRNYSDPPHYIGEFAKISNSLITEGCQIEGIVENSVLASGVKVARGAYIKDSIIMKNVTIAENTTINYSIIDSDTNIAEGCVIGRTMSANEQITVVGSDLNIQAGTDIPGGEMVNEEWIAKNGKNA
jgi:glucose-1-phosphate adenylyltransferase